MKKIEVVETWLSEHLAMFQCPVCQSAIVNLDQHSLICSNRHFTNINKHGYVYFMNHAAKGEYSREMLLDRRKLLQAGLFKPMVEVVARRLSAQDETILDVGTGEGTPLDQIRQARASSNDTYLGFDIAKDGVQLATQLDPHLFVCVAGLRKLPFPSPQFSTIVEFFSPSDYGEFKRVLKPGGQVLKVIPNPDYLIELRQLLYADDQGHQTYSNQSVKDLFKVHYPQMEEERIQYQFYLPFDLRSSLVKMSPLHWGKSAKTLTDEDLIKLTQVTVDVQLLIGHQS